jgi:16S rRNA (cytosine967-C5)-methyltransferase
MDNNRRTVYHTLMDVETKNAYSNIAINHQIILHKPNNVPFVRELAYGVLENKMLLDYIIDALIPRDVSKLKAADLTILRMGIYQLARMEYSSIARLD